MPSLCDFAFCQWVVDVNREQPVNANGDSSVTSSGRRHHVEHSLNQLITITVTWHPGHLFSRAYPGNHRYSRLRL
jgi:hypothetical protein